MINYIRNRALEKKIIDYLTDKGAKRIEFFGSYARGEEYNDIDVIVEFDKNISLLDFIGYQLDLEELTGKKIDLLTKNGISKYILPYINKEKRVVYETNCKFKL